MRYAERATVCVSSQAGCAMGCTFCATGQAGFERHLDCRRDRRAGRARRSTSAAAGVATSCSWAWASRSRTSTRCSTRASGSTTTSGSRPATSPSRPSAWCPACAGSREHHLPVTLAVSLHAPDDELRATLVPLNRRYPIAEVLDAAREYAGDQGPAGHVRVRLHRRRERLSPSRPRRSPGASPGCAAAPTSTSSRSTRPAEFRGPGARPRADRSLRGPPARPPA